MSTPLKVLVAEDSEPDAELLIRELRRHGYEPTWARVHDAPTMRKALRDGRWDIVFSDSSMPQFSAIAALSILKEADLDIPFVIVSGTIGEEAAVAAMRSGARDFVSKERLGRLAPILERELEERKVREARRRAEVELRTSESRHRVLFEKCPLPMWVFDVDTLAFLAVNEEAVRHYGYARDEFLKMTLEDVRVSDEAASARDSVTKLAVGGEVRRHRKKDGSTIQVEVRAHDFDFEGRRACLVTIIDVTERRHLEEQLRQSQKMEAVGKLAGGIAHDFNNMLSVILSYGEMILQDLPEGDPVRDDVDEMRKAGRRAADLTRQLLLFSRQQVVEPRVLDLNEVLAGMEKMLQRLVGADVELTNVPASGLGRVRVDRGSMEQVVMNLVVNARDAMPTGGSITMETQNVVLDEAYARAHHGVKAGPHVMLAVTDTGVGMDRATLARVFEPFFTTKEKGKGTGLGLSTVFGIVQQSGGSVWVYSERGKGTTFKVYLPRVDAPVEAPRVTLAPATLRGTETILLAEDDEQVRAVVKGILGKSGYKVIESSDPKEALLLAKKHRGKIHLLLTDVVMPRMSGPELARRMKEIRPQIRVLCMSGYTGDSIVRHGFVDAGIPFVTKPITPESLTSKVREVLGARPAAAR